MGLTIAVALRRDDEPGAIVEAITRGLELPWNGLPYATQLDEDEPHALVPAQLTERFKPAPKSGRGRTAARARSTHASDAHAP